MTETALNDLIATNVPDNTSQFVTPARVRQVLEALVDTIFERMQAPETITVSGADTIALLAGEILEAVVADPSGSSLLKIGFSLGTGELLDTDLGGVMTFIRMDYYADVNTTLHVTGDCELTIFVKKP